MESNINWEERYRALQDETMALKAKYDNILATENGHENKTENVWQSGYASGYDAGYERRVKDDTALRTKCRKMEKALKKIRDVHKTDSSAAWQLNRVQNIAIEALHPQEGEKEVTCKEAKKACDQLDVCQTYGRCLRENCAGLSMQSTAPHLTPGAPTETGTYFAVVKSYVNEEMLKCVLHYQKHKGVYRAVGHAFQFYVNPEDVIGYINEGAGERKQGAVWVKASEFKTYKPIYRPYRRKRNGYDEHEYDYGEIYVTEDQGRIFLDINNERTYEPQTFETWKDFEILDESSGKEVDDWISIDDQLPTTHGPAIQVLIQNHTNTPIVNHWREIQRIKNEVFGPEVMAIEYFPAANELIDTHNIYWIFIFPDGMIPKLL